MSDVDDVLNPDIFSRYGGDTYSVGAPSTPDPGPIATVDVPPPRPSAEDAMTRNFEMMREEFADSRARRDRIEQERRETEGPLRERLTRELDKPLPEIPRLRNAPPAPKQNIQQDVQGFLGSAMIIGALGGLKGRLHATNAMNAFAGAVNGFREAKQADFDNRLKEWEAAVKGIKEANGNEIARYKAIFENRQMSVEQKQAALKLAASEFQNQAMYETARTNDIMHSAQLYQQLVFHQQQIDQKAEALTLAAERVAMEREKLQTQQGSMLDDDALRSLVERRLTGDKSVTTRLGGGWQGRADLAAYNNLLAATMNERGITGAKLQQIDQEAAARGVGKTAGARTLNTQAANLDLIMTSAEAAIPAALEASNKVARGTLRRLNHAQQIGEQEISDPLLRDLAIKNLQVAELWARAMNPKGVMRESDRDLALQNLNIADSNGTYETALRAVKQFLHRERKAVQDLLEGKKPADDESDEWDTIAPGVRVRKTAP